MGCVEFSRTELDAEHQRQKFVFVRRKDREFEPRDADQPLRYAMTFALAEQHKGRNWFMGLINFFTGFTNRFVKALEQFSSKRTEFTRYGNPDLLR